ncbi:medium chain dehydrogenase/reductase family protein [Aequorivita marisscotiae]|jgi:NADPH2:quinone reductase|uniref:Medium chain dehydrogenase/reductase family protein n=1 Tax=Aequorivita marisscotiae TaxID=3040348 RepID=A0ABY8KV77_9FLAO|nr:medium chain dehydrogenase/reductase family protein [Aequorivita sp. Ant34-E75]WGF91671.1 medium chain dehydrogenase/reductase family protein [Aequorivita sp. Ant34-E75]
MQYRRIVISKFGSPEVLQEITEKELPKPQKGQVRIKVLTTSASFTDTLVRRGIYPDVKEKPPFSPGYDLVGIVDELGEGVNNLTVGQKVADLTIIGAYTEYICLDANSVVPVPNDLDNGEVVSLILTYLTAYQMLHHFAKVKDGQTILIHACAGAVGTAMIQLGKLMDLKMYGTASKNKHDFVKRMGAIPIDYKQQDFVKVMKEKEANGIDAVFDPMGGDYFSRSLSVLKKTGILVGFGFQNSASGNGGNVIIDFMKIHLWNLLPSKPSAKFYVITSIRKKHPKWFREDLNKLFKLLSERKIKPEIGKIMRLNEASEAHKLVEKAMVKGKIILKVTE